MSHFKKNWKMRMSSMNEDFQDPGLIKTEVNDQSLLTGLKQSPQSSPQSAAAALQALLDRSGQANGHNGLYQAAFNSSPVKATANSGGGGLGSLLTSKELAKLNLDVRNFKLQDSASSPQMQLQYNLNSLLGGSNGANLNQLLLQQAGIDSNLLSGLMNSLNTNEKLNLLAKGRQSTPIKSSRPSMTNGGGRIEDHHQHDDETVSAAAAMLAAAGHGLNIGMINKHNQAQQRQARRNGDLIKGNSMSPSPRGTSCSEETETLHSSSGSPLSSTHDAVVNGVGGHHSSSSSSASASGSDTGRQRRRQKDASNGGANLGTNGGGGGGASKYHNDEDGDLDDVDEDSRSSPNGSHSPHSSSLTQNGDHDLTANHNGDCDNSMMDNAEEDEEDEENGRDLDDGDLDEDDLDEDQYDTTTNSSMNNSQALNASAGRQRSGRKSQKGQNDSASARNRNNSASSPTRSSSSQGQSRSVSPSLYHRDSPSSSSAAAAAAFPNLAAVAAANGIDSATAMLAAQSLLQQQTPGLTFPSLAASGLSLGGPTVAASTSSSSSSKDQATTRKRRNDREAMSERIKKIKPVPADKKDDAYWERRRKNNEAAKRSRDLRRQKEDEIAVRASFLEQENLKLKAQVTILKAELSKLHFMLYNR